MYLFEHMIEHLSVWIKISWERSWNFALSRDKKLHISGHDGSVKVGVKQNCIERDLYMLCSHLDQRVYLNMRSKKNPSNSNFAIRRARQFVPVLIFGVNKKPAFER